MCKLRRYLTFRRAELLILRLGSLILLGLMVAKLLKHELASW